MSVFRIHEGEHGDCGAALGPLAHGPELAGPSRCGPQSSGTEFLGPVVGFSVEGLDHVALGVADQRRSVEWYRDVLGLRREYEAEWGDTPAVLAGGGSGVALFAGPDGAAGGLRHIAFRVDAANFLAAQEHLRSRRIPFELQNHGVARSIYFVDPDGIQLELTTYED